MKITLPFLFANKNWPIYAVPYYVDTLIPKQLKKHLPLGDKLAYLLSPLPSPASKKFIEPDVKFDGYELMLEMNSLLDKDWNIRTKRLAKYVERNYPIETVHGIMSATFKPNKYLDFRLDNSDHDLCFKALKNQILIAKKLCKSDPILIIHLNELKKPTKEQQKLSIENSIKNLKNITSVLEENQVHLALENCFDLTEHTCYDSRPHIIKQILNDVNSDLIGVNLDWGHANEQARQDYEKSSLSEKQISKFEYHKKFISELKDHIIYLHLHYNNRHLIATNGKDTGYFSGRKFSEVDQHRSLQDFTDHEFLIFTGLLKELLTNNKIKKICIESLPTHFFLYIQHLPYGTNDKGMLKSVEMLRKIIENN